MTCNRARPVPLKAGVLLFVLGRIRSAYAPAPALEAQMLLLAKCEADAKRVYELSHLKAVFLLSFSLAVLPLCSRTAGNMVSVICSRRFCCNGANSIWPVVFAPSCSCAQIGTEPHLANALNFSFTFAKCGGVKIEHMSKSARSLPGA